MSRRPRIGALGTGWIGRHRLEVLQRADLVDIVAVADPVPAALDGALAIAPHATPGDTLDDLLACDLDGLVIATPTAQHAAQALQALRARVAVCSQKPLARSEAEAAAVVRAARDADRLLAVDFSYRYTAAAQALRQAIAEGALGRLVGAELVFHNAYGPDKAWYRSRSEAGGGCVMDLGVHLIDLLTWLTGDEVEAVRASSLFTGGEPWRADGVEDFAQCHLALRSGATASLTCSWWLSAGCDAVIGVTLFGTQGSLRMHNVDGSFYDFAATQMSGTHQQPISGAPDDWGGRAVVAWAQRLVQNRRYHPECEAHVPVSRTLDAIYAAAGDGKDRPSGPGPFVTADPR